MGRYIAIYYGPFLQVYGQLMHTLKHEFTHHLESLARERGLEIKDAQYLTDYLNRKDR